MVTCDKGQIKPRSKWRKENLQSGEMKERLLSFFPSSFSQSKLAMEIRRQQHWCMCVLSLWEGRGGSIGVKGQVVRDKRAKE